MPKQVEVKVEITRNTCKHIINNHNTYRAIAIDGQVWILCRACYGDLVMQILDDLKDVKIKAN